MPANKPAFLNAYGTVNIPIPIKHLNVIRYVGKFLVRNFLDG